MPCYCTQEDQLKSGHKAIESAIDAEHLECVRYAIKDGLQSWYPTRAAALGNVKILECLLENGCPTNDKILYEYAIRKGSLECVKLARSYKCEWDMDIWFNVTRFGRLDILIWLHDNGCPTINYTMIYACPNFEMVKYLVGKGYTIPKECCESAVKSGNFKLLKYIHNHGCKLTRSACNDAAKLNHIKMFKYMLAHGCKWNSWYCLSHFASNRNLKMVKFVVNYIEKNPSVNNWEDE